MLAMVKLGFWLALVKSVFLATYGFTCIYGVFLASYGFTCISSVFLGCYPVTQQLLLISSWSSSSQVSAQYSSVTVTCHVQFTLYLVSMVT